MWSMPVVMADKLSDHGLEVALVDDERSIEALAPDGADEALGESVCPRG
jgi:hypothetical protein